MPVEQLLELGLTKNQAKVYLQLLAKPEQSAGDLARKLSIDRSFMYGVLKSLADKGFVAHVTKENRRVFSASPPESLFKELDEKRTLASSLVKELEKMKQQKEQATTVNVYEGKAGLKIVAREMLKEKEFEILGGGGTLQTVEELKYEYPHIIHLLRQKKVSGRIFVSQKNFLRLQKLLEKTNITLKIIKKKPSQVNFVIFGDTLAIYTSDALRTIFIKDKQISEALRIYFTILWNKVIS